MTRGVTVTVWRAPARSTSNVSGRPPLVLMSSIARSAGEAALAVDREDDVVQPQAGLIGRRAWRHEQDLGARDGAHADVTQLVLADRRRHERHALRAPASIDRDLDLAIRERENRRREAFPVGNLDAVDGDDAIARLNTGRLSRRALGTVPTTTGSLSNAGTSMPCCRTSAVMMTASARFITGPMTSTWKRCHFVFDRNSSDAPVGPSCAILAGHLDVAAERDGAQAVPRCRRGGT